MFQAAFQRIYITDLCSPPGLCPKNVRHCLSPGETEVHCAAYSPRYTGTRSSGTENDLNIQYLPGCSSSAPAAPRCDSSLASDAGARVQTAGPSVQSGPQLARHRIAALRRRRRKNVFSRTLVTHWVAPAALRRTAIIPGEACSSCQMALCHSASITL